MRPLASDLQHWLLTEGRTAGSMDALLARFGAELARHAPVHRIWAGTTVLHPQAAAWLWIWEQGQGVVERELSYDRFARLVQLDSFARRMELGAPSTRARRGDPDIPEDSRALFEEHGYIEVFGLPYTIRGQWAGAVTWGTRAAAGFTEDQRALLRSLMPALSAVMEPLTADLVTGVLLRTYLGADPGNRVHQGAVKRGDGTTHRAVVWFSDLRGFTRLSATLDRDALLDLLNDGFEVVVGCLEAHGAEVLKFMGDGLLAMFPATADDPSGARACAAARAAALELQRRLADLSTARGARGLARIQMGVGLHYGDVSYGNIGAPSRLDFTVIGPAVNLASRVEGLCGGLGATVLATEAFVARDGGGWVERGRHTVKGVAAPVVVFSPQR